MTADDLYKRFGRRALAATVLYFYPTDATARLKTRMALTGTLVRSGMDADLVTEYVQTVAALADDPKWHEDFAERTERRLEDDKPVTGIPKLVKVLQLPEACERTFHEWLGEAGDDPPLIQDQSRQTLRNCDARRKGVAHIGSPNISTRQQIGPADHRRGCGDLRQKTRVARLVEIDAAHLRDLLDEKVRWQRNHKTKNITQWLPTDVPHEVATRILARRGEWKFPKVTGVISTPTMRYDGTILDKEGYDPATELLLLARPPMPPIPERPTKEDAEQSLRLLEDLLVEFPLVGEVDKAVALSALSPQWCVPLSRSLQCMQLVLRQQARARATCLTARLRYRLGISCP